MVKNKPIYIFAVILIAIVSIAISVVVLAYNKDKPIIPDKYIEVLSSNDMSKIKIAYEGDEKKQEFLNLCASIELAVANKLLDGSVTNDQELAVAISKINNVLVSNDWSYLGIDESTYWMGKWKLDTNGALSFTFQEADIKPNWAQDEDVKKYIK